MDFDDLDDAEEEVMGDDGPPKKMPEWTQVEEPMFDITEMRDRAKLDLPGDYYGIPFPHEKDQILSPQWGAKWLTDAFFKTGVITVDNEVSELVSIKDVTGQVSGGAGLKYVLKVNYKEDKSYLHKELFVKLPHEPKGSDRYYVSCMWRHDRPETVFNIWLSGFVPFRVPKLYFCDINKESTNFILITEAIKFAPKGTKEFGPGDMEPAYDKFWDWEIPDGGVSYYLAACKNLGKMAAYHKTERLHPQVNDMFPMPGDCFEIPKGIPGVDPESRKMNSSKADSFIKFMSETAKAVMPPEISNPKWLEEWKQAMLHVQDYENEINCFCMGAGTAKPNDYVCLTHNNLQIDNAFFYRNDDNGLEVGMLDWGALSCGPFIGAIQGGCISGAQVDVYLENRETWIRAAMDAYEEHGGPKLDFERMKLMCDLQVANWACGSIRNVTAVLKDTKSAEWTTITDWMDDKIMKRFYVRAHCTQFKYSLQLWQKLDVYGRFKQWLKDEGLPERKQ